MQEGNNSQSTKARARKHRARKEADPVSFWKKILLAIPKNLVYIFVGIVFFAFAAMCYITYTEKDLAQFLRYEHSQEVVIVDPLYTQLKESLIEELDKHKPVDAQKQNFIPKVFFNHFLNKNRPVIIRQYASNWKATKTWGDLDYLADQAGNTIVRLHTFNKFPWEDKIRDLKLDSKNNTDG